MCSSTPNEAGNSDDVFKAEPEQDAEAIRTDTPEAAFTIAICDVDLPAFIYRGELYVQAPIQDIFDAFAASMCGSIRHLETGISETRSAALSSAALQRVLPGFRVAERYVVSGGWE
jgi:hypothetical protein